MPIYEYKCPIHGIFEVIEKESKGSRACPDCGNPSHKIISRISRPIVKMLIHKDSTLPQEYIDNTHSELYDMSLTRQGKSLDPEDI